MSLTYVIPDLHGRSDLLDLALARIDAHAAAHILQGAIDALAHLPRP